MGWRLRLIILISIVPLTGARAELDPLVEWMRANPEVVGAAIETAMADPMGTSHRLMTGSIRLAINNPFTQELLRHMAEATATPPTTSRNGLRAESFSSRKYPKAEPEKRLVPDFDVMLTTPPVTPPNSALSLCDWTLNSCRESMSGNAT